VDKLENEKRLLLGELTGLRDRVLELSNAVSLRDNDLARERSANDDLAKR
jgi:hypothetical protein